jgi:hypothetical protein
MKKLLVVLSLVVIANCAKATTKSINLKETKIEKVLKNQGLEYEINSKVENTKESADKCTVTITVSGPAGEPYGTYTGVSYISCQLAFQYAMTDLIATIFSIVF